jgi:nitrogen fixation/metabolism regulation signal transduction histidine kinase
MMHPAAWASLSRGGCSHWVQTEQIGNLPYLSAYRPLQTSEGKTVAYLHMPYFAKEKNQRQEVAGFMVALINVYVLLLVAAGLVALGISNSVTRSLTRISAQFQKIRVGERNEPIAWKSNDEIGLLVAEYNKMLGELERSAALLARSERESAWREMARQVAHEIKNPLTPMRLSIQHLQRTIAAGDPRAEELTGRVSRTLLEQIETLSHIATEFSNFAQMPTPSPEQVDLGQVLRSIVALYEAEEGVDSQLSLPSGDVLVWADRQQLQRVFSNLLKNAIQAIPDDRKGQIRVVMASVAGQVRVQVVDNGSGIDEDQRARVFVPNFTTKSSGMGLGLAMSKNIVEYAGGRIDFESQPGVGTTFSVTLPVFIPGQGPKRGDSLLP